jgi:hypothetical protein
VSTLFSVPVPEAFQAGHARTAISLWVVETVLSIIPGYWSAAILALAAVVLLILGAPTQAALAGAGFAFFGAALTRGIDVGRERRTAAAETQASRRRDLDETRRLTYAALLAP